MLLTKKNFIIANQNNCKGNNNLEILLLYQFFPSVFNKCFTHKFVFLSEPVNVENI